MRATELAHLAIRRSVNPGDCAIDATVGNGHDTLFLAELVGPSGRVFGFDVQETALASAAEKLGGLPQVRLVHAGHETLAEHLAANDRDRLAAAMFNLGYMPGGPKDIVTRPETTLSALRQALDHLKINGVVTLVLYPGHPGGAEEADAVRSLALGLPPAFTAHRHAPAHTVRPAPELIVIERQR